MQVLYDVNTDVEVEVMQEKQDDLGIRDCQRRKRRERGVVRQNALI